MKQLFTSALILFLLSSSLPVKAQKIKLHWGLANIGTLKQQLVPVKGEKYSPWGSFGLSMVNVVDGVEESTLSFALKSGLMVAFETYDVNNFLTFGTDKIMACLNPEALLPIGSGKSVLSAGIGLNFHFDTRIWINGSSGSAAMAAYYYGNFEYKERNIIPFISIGYLRKLKRNFSLQVLVHQQLLNSYYKDEYINLGDDLSPVIVKLGHMPTSLGLSVWYMFN